MSTQFVALQEAEKILSGDGIFVVAADDRVLKKLPKGNWIGGSIPYFMTTEGGRVDQNKVFITELPSFVKLKDIKLLDEAEIEKVYTNIPEAGFGIIIVPALTPINLSFAVNSPNYPSFAKRPLIGWISGLHLNDLDHVAPKVINGRTGQTSEARAIVMNIDIPDGYVVDIGVVNIFEQGVGDVLQFPENGYNAKEVIVNGKKQNFSEYVAAKKIDTKLPLVANYAGARINVSFLSVDDSTKTVHLYAPVFAGVEYRLAKPVADYVKDFEAKLPKNSDQIAFSCNCILNFLYGELEGKKTGGVTGPITFGEIAYQLLNQTMAFLTITRKESKPELNL